MAWFATGFMGWVDSGPSSQQEMSVWQLTACWKKVPSMLILTCLEILTVSLWTYTFSRSEYFSWMQNAVHAGLSCGTWCLLLAKWTCGGNVAWWSSDPGGRILSCDCFSTIKFSKKHSFHNEELEEIRHKTYDMPQLAMENPQASLHLGHCCISNIKR